MGLLKKTELLLEEIKKKKIQTECDGAACVAGGPTGAPCDAAPTNVSAAANPPNQTPPMPTVPPHPKPTYKAGIHTRNVGPGAYVPFVVPGAIYRRNAKKKRRKRRKS